VSFVYVGLGVITAILYLIFMIWVYIHLGRKVETLKTKDELTLTILIACRNEALRLPRLAKALKHFKGQLIVIDDHSEDQTAAEATKLLPQALLIKNAGAGKKAALKTGLARANGSKVLCLDADILIDKDWINRCQSYLAENAADLYLFPVLVQETTNLFQQFEAFDMLGLMTITKASANANRPILANGAALCISRADFLDCQNELREDQASGDDVFLLQAMKKRDKHIHFVQDRRLIVYIEPHSWLKSFLKQRIRWGQKSNAYSDRFAKRVAWIVLLGNLWFCMSLWLAGALGARGAFDAQKLMLLFIVPKLAIDFIISQKANRHFQTGLNWKVCVFSSIIYPFYIIFVGISGFFYRPYWKGRKV
jgi:biofilm PGA synthesis N-glycosyltransferase PgaC